MKCFALFLFLAAACLAVAAGPAWASRTLLSEKLLHPMEAPTVPPDGQVEGACGLALSPGGGTLYVSDYYHRAVDAFSASTGGPTLGRIALPGENPVFGTNTLDAVCGLAMTSGGVLYANEWHQGVLRLTPGEQVFDAAESTGVAVDAAGDVYSDDRTYVAVYEPSGEPVEVEDPVSHEEVPLRIGAGSLGDGYGLAVSGGRVYVADASTDTVKVYEPSGDPSTPVATIGAGFVSMTDAALAIDPTNGHLLVVDDTQPGFEHPKAAIYEFEQTSATAYANLGRLPGAPVDGEPSGIVADPASGKLYVTDGNSEEANVFVYSAYGAASPALASIAPGGAGPETSSSAAASGSPPSSSTAAKHRRQGSARASEVTQRGKLRVSFSGAINPRALPRRGVAPVTASVGGLITATDGSDPPQLRRVAIALNRYGRIDPTGLPACALQSIQPSTSEGALEACRSSLVGEGRFSANVKLPTQSPFPSEGKVLAFNGVLHGKPVIFAHIFGTAPVPTSIVLPFSIKSAKGTYGTVLEASLPKVTGDWGYVTGLRLRLDRRFSSHGRRRSYVSAGCPAPKGFPGAVFPLMRTSFAFAGGVNLTSTLSRSCRVRGG